MRCEITHCADVLTCLPGPRTGVSQLCLMSDSDCKRLDAAGDVRRAEQKCQNLLWRFQTGKWSDRGTDVGRNVEQILCNCTLVAFSGI